MIPYCRIPEITLFIKQVDLKIEDFWIFEISEGLAYSRSKIATAFLQSIKICKSLRITRRDNLSVTKELRKVQRRFCRNLLPSNTNWIPEPLPKSFCSNFLKSGCIVNLFELECASYVNANSWTNSRFRRWKLRSSLAWPLSSLVSMD